MSPVVAQFATLALFVQEHSVDPVWALYGCFVVYSGPDIGTKLSVKAVTADAADREWHRYGTISYNRLRFIEAEGRVRGAGTS